MAAAHFSSAWVLLVFMVLFQLCFGGRVSISQQNLEVHKHLKQLNKPPLKSIKSPDGDIIDCVHISHQPAFDHPLFKNHTIQVRPNYHPEGLIDGKKVSMPQSNEGKSKSIAQLWHLNGKCPEGTIPIRRTKEEDLLRTSSVQSYGKKKHRSIPEPARSADPDLINQSGHQHAITYVEGQFYGAKATMNVWDPKIQQPNEFSLSQLWVLGGTFDSDLNSIEAGWQVLHFHPNSEFISHIHSLVTLLPLHQTRLFCGPTVARPLPLHLSRSSLHSMVWILNRLFPRRNYSSVNGILIICTIKNTFGQLRSHERLFVV